jgi:sec-independent protein translocase protein TatC
MEDCNLDENNLPYLLVGNDKNLTQSQKNFNMFFKEHIKDIYIFLVFNAIFFIIFCIIGYVYAPVIANFLLKPLDIMQNSISLIYNKITDLFFLRIAISLYFASSLTFYMICISIIFFLRYSMNKSELIYSIVFIAIFPILFAIGSGVSYYFLLPNGLEFLLSYQQDFLGKITGNITAVDYLSFISKMFFCCGMVCELPLLIIVLNRFGFIQKSTLKRFRRIAIVFSFVIAAIITPPDVTSQVVVAMIMLTLYEISILFCHDRKRD